MSGIVILIWIVVITTVAALAANKVVYNGWFRFPWTKAADNYALGKDPSKPSELKLLRQENEHLKQIIKDYEREAGKTSAYR